MMWKLSIILKSQNFTVFYAEQARLEVEVEILYNVT